MVGVNKLSKVVNYASELSVEVSVLLLIVGRQTRANEKNHKLDCNFCCSLAHLAVSLVF